MRNLWQRCFWIIGLMLVAMAVAATTGCGQGDTEPAPPPETPTESTVIEASLDTRGAWRPRTAPADPDVQGSPAGHEARRRWLPDVRVPASLPESSTALRFEVALDPNAPRASIWLGRFRLDADGIAWHGHARPGGFVEADARWWCQIEGVSVVADPCSPPPAAEQVARAIRRRVTLEATGLTIAPAREDPNALHRAGAIAVVPVGRSWPEGGTWAVAFEAGDRLSIRPQGRWAGCMGVRAVIRDATGWWVSQKQIEPARLAGVRGELLLEPDAERWAVLGDDPREFDARSASFVGHRFERVRAIGWMATTAGRVRRSNFSGASIHALAHVACRGPSSTSLRMVVVPEYLSETDGNRLAVCESFQASACEVPREAWLAIRRWAAQPGTSLRPGYRFATASLARVDRPDASQLPATGMAFADALAWCNALSEWEGRRPCYRTESGGVWRGEGSVVRLDWRADGYRLPAPSEWGRVRRFAQPDTRLAWVGENAEGVLQAVGTRRANTLGAYDVIGNAWEYVWDAEDRIDLDERVAPLALGGGADWPGGGSGSGLVGLRVIRTAGTGRPLNAGMVPPDAPALRVGRDDEAPAGE